MNEFPRGGWDLDAYDTFNDWANDIRDVPASRTQREVVNVLLRYHLRMSDLLSPAEFDEEGDDDDGYDDKGNPPNVPSAGGAGGGGRIRSRPRVKAEQITAANTEIVASDPRVSPMLSSYSS